MGARKSKHELRAAMRHYPTREEVARATQLLHVSTLVTPSDLRRAFRDDRARYRFLERLRFPHGFACWCCGVEQPPARGSDGTLRCEACGSSERITAGSVLDDVRLPVARWFDVLWWVAAGELAVDEEELTAALGERALARRVLVRLRALLARSEATPLSGIVELDGRVLDLGGRHEIVLVAVERDGAGRMRIRHAGSMAAPVVRAFVLDAVEPGSTVVTDCWSGYLGLGAAYRHELSEELGGLRAVSWAHRALRSWLARRALPPPAELQHLFDEPCLRHNHGELPTGELFCHLLQVALDTPPPPRGAKKRSGVQAKVTGAEDELDRTRSRQG